MKKQRPDRNRTMQSVSSIRVFPMLLAVMLLAVSCSASPTETDTVETSGSTQITSGATSAAGGTETEAVLSSVRVSLKDEDFDDSWDEAEATSIHFQESEISFAGEGAAIDGSTVTITAGGTYLLSGIMNDGQILVNADSNAVVRLVLNNMALTGSESAPLQVQSADKVILILAGDTENTITDRRQLASDAVNEADEAELDEETDEANAAIYSKEDLTITGGGQLTVVAAYRHGINCKDDLVITGGTITVQAAGDGIRGRDSVVVQNSGLRIEAAEDGIRSSNADEADKGYFVLESGSVNITAGRDGIQTAGQLVVNGGSITIDAADDAIHSNNLIEIRDGTLCLESGDDGIHADTRIEIIGGSITIDRSYEGIESAAIYIRDGDIRITSSDDAINVADSNIGAAMNGRPGQNNFNPAASSGQRLEIHGGNIIMDGQGDGIDVNGSILMTGGTVLVYGPTSDMNGALDYDGAFAITGGFLVAAGSSGMAQAPDLSSSQYSIQVNLTSVIPAETLVYVASASGETIVAFDLIRPIQSLVVSSPTLKAGDTVTVYSGGDVQTEMIDGLLIGGMVEGGVEVASLILNQVTTTYGSVGMAGGRPGRR